MRECIATSKHIKRSFRLKGNKPDVCLNPQEKKQQKALKIWINIKNF